MTARFLLGPKKSTLAKALVGAESMTPGREVKSFQIITTEEVVADDSITPWPMITKTSYQVVMMFEAELKGLE